jgi:hypothetical protein
MRYADPRAVATSLTYRLSMTVGVSYCSAVLTTMLIAAEVSSTVIIRVYRLIKGVIPLRIQIIYIFNILKCFSPFSDKMPLREILLINTCLI